MCTQRSWHACATFNLGGEVYALLQLNISTTCVAFFQNNLHVVTRCHGYAGYRSLYGIGPQLIRVLLHGHCRPG